MSFLFNKPKTPTIPNIAPPKTPAPPPAEEEVKEEEKKKLKKKKKTILTSPQGILEPATVGLKTLLGE